MSERSEWRKEFDLTDIEKLKRDLLMCSELWAARLAFVLLEEREPVVMTLGDVRRDHDRVLWIECDDSKTQSIGQYRGQVCWHDRHIGKWERFTIIGFANDYLHRETEKYGKTWRCWSARPTPEQMRDTKWEDSDADQ